jgi:hypothetical protein
MDCTYDNICLLHYLNSQRPTSKNKSKDDNNSNWFNDDDNNNRKRQP